MFGGGGSMRPVIPSSPALAPGKLPVPVPSSAPVPVPSKQPAQQVPTAPIVNREFVTNLTNESKSLSDTINQIQAFQKKNTETLGQQSSILSESETYVNNVKSYTALINKELDGIPASSINTYKKMILDNKAKLTTLDSTIAAGRNLLNTYNSVIPILERGGMSESMAKSQLASARGAYDNIFAQMKNGGDLVNLGAPQVEVKAITNPPRPPKVMSVSNFSDYGGAAPAWTNSIPSWLICDWYYVLFVLNLALSIVLVAIFVFASKKKLSGARLNAMIIPILFSSVSTLFFYLMCDRSLKPAAY
jgi:hypothetical protein